MLLRRNRAKYLIFTIILLPVLTIFYILYSIIIVDPPSPLVIEQIDIIDIYHHKNEDGSEHLTWIFEVNGIDRCLSDVQPAIPSIMADTCMSLANPEELVFPYYAMLSGGFLLLPKKKEKERPLRTLLIGLGGGALPTAYHSIIPEMELHIVEINPIMEEIAEKYFNFAHYPTTKVFIQDGTKFIARVAQLLPNTYDFIIIDAYDQNGKLPEGFKSKEFIRNVRQALNNSTVGGGVMAMNVFRDPTKSKSKSSSTVSNSDIIEELDDNKSFEKMYQYFKETFGSFYVLEEGNNKVVLAVNGDLPTMNIVRGRKLEWEDKFAQININTEWLLDQFIQK